MSVDVRSLGARARDWILPLGIDPAHSSVLEAGFDKLVLCAMWDLAIGQNVWGPGIYPWCTELNDALGLRHDCPELQASKRRLDKIGWTGMGPWCASLAWRAPFRAADIGSVYAVEFSNGVCKIGRSRDWEKRVKTHIRLAAKHGLKSTREWWIGDLSDSVAAERAVLEHVSRSCEIVGGREYFLHGFEPALAYFGDKPETALAFE